MHTDASPETEISQAQSAPGQPGGPLQSGRRLGDYARWALAACGCLLLAAAAAVLAFDQSRGQVIQSYTKVDGVSIGGMDANSASARLSHDLSGPLQRPVTVTASGKSFQLFPARAGVSPDFQATVGEALAKTRAESPLMRTAHSVLGTSDEVQPRLKYPPQAIDGFVASIKRAADQPVRDANVVPSAGNLQVVPQADGHLIDGAALTTGVERALGEASSPRQVDAVISTVKPRVTVDQLPGKYPFYITIDRPNFQLRLYKDLKLIKTYPIAVGQAGLDTPAGLYHVETKEVNPAWHVPNSAWAGPLRGQTIPADSPQDPIKARWMGLADGVGIHGTDEVGSIGTAGSHGCIRMEIPQVIDLYNQVPQHTPVFIG